MNRKFLVLTFIIVLIASLSGSSNSGVRAESQLPATETWRRVTSPENH